MGKRKIYRDVAMAGRKKCEGAAMVEREKDRDAAMGKRKIYRDVAMAGRKKCEDAAMVEREKDRDTAMGKRKIYRDVAMAGREKCEGAAMVEREKDRDAAMVERKKCRDAGIAEKIIPMDNDKDTGTRKGIKLLYCFSCLLYCIFFAGCLCGCGLTETDSKKVKDVEYQILGEKDIPQELLAMIEEKKQAGFKLTYTDEEFLYIAIGYGEQETGGYSIAVDDCYLTKNAIYFATTLIGPMKGEKINQVKSYPYLVVQTKNWNKNVVFE